ncbi:cytosolic protein [Alkalihalobacillus sp. MEB130]|uniref:cytosolic protein n=1 Tax=Alkalihalobacillus sp. MEB130 TaxID=2976704 RepID=UPI0028DF9C7E|nr:cytosolic protein [Alkalihalobacillus sp. MEB130]MDT8858646.1 cytosolic protein [Alkalihalobacillus sp. MEB130]
MTDKEEQQYFDFSNVETQRNFLAAEDFPEGPYGSPINKDKPVSNKSTPWEPGQRYYSAFNYEFKSLHQNLPRQFPGAHPTHDDPNKNEEPPYTTND